MAGRAATPQREIALDDLLNESSTDGPYLGRSGRTEDVEETFTETLPVTNAPLQTILVELDGGVQTGLV